MILEPLSGCPSGVRDLADRLTASSRRVGDVTTVLVALKGGATWVSSAGEAFGARLAEAPPLLDAVARRLGGAAVPLREIADAMEEAQRVVEGAIRDDSEAQGTYALLEDRAYALISAGADETSPDVVAVRILQRDQVRIRERARARHAAAMERFRAVDARCSASVRALTQDAVTDSALYRLVAGSQTVGRDLAAVTELAELLMVWVTFLSGASAARRGAQMTITEFIDKLGGKGRERADAAIDVLAIGMLLLLFWYGINLVIVGWGNELTVLQIPMSFQYLGMPVGVAAILVWTVYDLWQIGQGKTRAQRWAKG